jgi:hypothetical protein
MQGLDRTGVDVMIVIICDFQQNQLHSSRKAVLGLFLFFNALIAMKVSAKKRQIFGANDY